MGDGTTIRSWGRFDHAAYREFTWLLADAGFAVAAGYGCTAGDFRRRPLGVDDIEIMMVARRA